MGIPRPSLHERKRRALWGAALAAAFALGLIIGAHTCNEPLPPPLPEVVLAPCDCPTIEPAPVDTVTPTPRPPPRGLPPAPPPDPEVHRQKLLAWVRTHSAELDACRGTAKTQVRVAVTITLSQGRTPQTATVNASPGEVSAETLGCVKARVSAWQLPSELTVGRRELIFGLTL